LRLIHGPAHRGLVLACGPFGPHFAANDGTPIGPLKGILEAL
jgi:hypothetical protein